MKARIVEVGPRDGLQNEKETLSVSDRVRFVEKLANAGVQFIEVGSFVSPRWVPQMENSIDVVRKVYRVQAKAKIPSEAQFSALVPNMRGMEDALKTPLEEIAIFGACSESFSKKNTNCSTAEAFTRFQDVVTEAKRNKIRVRGYVSTVFGCPYEGRIPEAQVIKVIKKFADLGLREISLGDTIGVATPKQVVSLLRKLKRSLGLRKLAVHFHDTRGTALANVYASLNEGVRIFDSSLGGLGGCPYAKGASGNLATEDLVYMLEGMGVETGIDLKALIKIKPWIEKKVGRSLPSRVASAGLGTDILSVSQAR